MRLHAIAFAILIVTASVAGCIADEDVIVYNEEGDGCTVLLQIVETAKHSPGNTSWTNHTYDENCKKINTTITGNFDEEWGDYQDYNVSIDYDSSGNIEFMNTTWTHGSDEWGWTTITTLQEYYYDANGTLLSIVALPRYDGAPFHYENYSYDSSGRETMVVYETELSHRNGRTSWKNTTYNSNGQISIITMVGIVDTPENITYHYDSNDLLNHTIESYEWNDGYEVYTYYTYDSQDRLIQVERVLEGYGRTLISTSYDGSGHISTEIEEWQNEPGIEVEEDTPIEQYYTRTYTWGQIEIESETDTETEADTDAGNGADADVDTGSDADTNTDNDADAADDADADPN